jgi:hypothetical protein
MKRRTIVRSLSAAVLAFPLTTLVWLGCGSDGSGTPATPLPTPDAQPPVADAAQDTGTSDAGSDAGDAGPESDAGDAGPESDAGDAGPESDAGSDASDAGPESDAGSDASDAGPAVIREIGTVGVISIQSTVVNGLLTENGVALRMSSDHPCGAYVVTDSMPYVGGGDLQIAGGLIGNADAGGLATTPLVVSPGGAYSEYIWAPAATEVLYSTATSTTLQLSTTGSAAVPAIASQTLSTPTSGSLTVSKPTQPDGGSSTPIVVPASEDYLVTWTPPSTPMATSVLFRINDITPNLSGDNKYGYIQCIFPIASGTGSVPSALLQAVRDELGAPSTGGNLTVNVADAKVVRPGNTGRVILLAVDTSVSSYKGGLASMP